MRKSVKTHTYTQQCVPRQGSGACRKGPGHNRVSLSMDGRIPSPASVSLPLSPPSLSPLLHAAGRRQSSHQQSPRIISSTPFFSPLCPRHLNSRFYFHLHSKGGKKIQSSNNNPEHQFYFCENRKEKKSVSTRKQSESHPTGVHLSKHLVLT